MMNSSHFLTISMLIQNYHNKFDQTSSTRIIVLVLDDIVLETVKCTCTQSEYCVVVLLPWNLM